MAKRKGRRFRERAVGEVERSGAPHVDIANSGATETARRSPSIEERPCSPSRRGPALLNILNYIAAVAAVGCTLRGRRRASSEPGLTMVGNGGYMCVCAERQAFESAWLDFFRLAIFCL